jgi:hypothetical protein
MSGGESYTGNLGADSPNFTGYSPADFADAEDTRPVEVALDLTGSGIAAPYTTLVTNVMARQIVEIREKTVNPSLTPSAWKKRMKEFMVHKNEDLLGFLNRSLQTHPTLGKAQVFFRRFGMQGFTPTHQSFREILLDISGQSAIGKLEEEMKRIGPSTSSQLVDQMKWLYDEYRITGDNCLRKEAALKAKLEAFDKVYQKVLGLLQLPFSQDTVELSKAVELYLESVFKEQNLEQLYSDCIESYRRFTALREMIHIFRITELSNKEPLCSICLTEGVQECFVPCGHTYCSTCSKRQLTNCSMCRSNIRERVKLYFG